MAGTPSSSSRRRSLRSQARSEAFGPFQIGDIVEVGGHEDGLHGSWWLATILKFMPLVNPDDPKLVQVRYHELLSEKYPGEALVEEVEIIHLRPEVPREPHRVFRINEEVDAYHDDGWWEGVLTRIIINPEQPGKKTYSLFFRTSKEQLEFDEENKLRLHREWVHGEWVPPFEEPAPADVPDQQESAAGEEAPASAPNQQGGEEEEDA